MYLLEVVHFVALALCIYWNSWTGLQAAKGCATDLYQGIDPNINDYVAAKDPLARSGIITISALMLLKLLAVNVRAVSG